MSNSNAKDKILELISSMSVMDIVELISDMEKKFGVSSRDLPSTDNINSSNSNAHSDIEKTEFDIVLKSIGKNKISCIRAVRSMTSLGLKDAKDLVESAPVTIKKSVTKSDAERFKKILEESGAVAEIK